VNHARHLGIDPEAALRDAVTKFEARFREVESLADKPLGEIGIDGLEMLWQRAKREI
jgi:ATP diphosphatase